MVSNFRSELIFSLQSDERERQWHYTQLELISQKIRAIPLTSAQSVSNAQHLKNDIPHSSAQLQALFPDSTFVPLLCARLLCRYYECNISTLQFIITGILIFFSHLSTSWYLKICVYCLHTTPTTTGISDKIASIVLFRAGFFNIVCPRMCV